jgi:integrase
MEAQLAYFCASAPIKMEESTFEHASDNFGDRLAEEISESEIRSWLNGMAAKRGWAIGTKRSYRTAIRICYHEAKRLDHLRVDPTEKIKFKREDQKEVRAVNPDELDRIRASIAIAGKRRTPAFCRKCLAQLEIASQTGMRKSEQHRAGWERIDWERCTPPHRVS